jgi:hypothetical protein
VRAGVCVCVCARALWRRALAVYAVVCIRVCRGGRLLFYGACRRATVWSGRLWWWAKGVRGKAGADCASTLLCLVSAIVFPFALTRPLAHSCRVALRLCTFEQWHLCILGHIGSRHGCTYTPTHPHTHARTHAHLAPWPSGRTGAQPRDPTTHPSPCMANCFKRGRLPHAHRWLRTVMSTHA